MTAYLPGGRPYFQLYRPAHGHAPLKRRATRGKSSIFLLIQSCLCQYVKDLTAQSARGGEYRIRTDGLLHAMQAL